MSTGVRVLYLLRADESHPPTDLLRAAGAVHLLRAGNAADGPTCDFNPQVICIRAPFDRDARVALDAVTDLDLPVLSIGNEIAEGLTAQVSDVIPSEDLRTVLELLVSASNAQKANTLVCHAQDTGNCLGRAVDGLLRLLEHLLSLRFPDYRERAERVFDASLWIGNHLCLPPPELKDLLNAARLRELGKLGLPDSIVFARRSERAPEEQAIYNRYPELGAHVMAELPSLRTAAKIVECQLENFDGSGPAGLMAHQIPLGSRILRVAAAFTGIATSKENWEGAAQEAIAVLEQGRGAQFDPLLVKLVCNFHQASKRNMPKSATRWVRVADLAEGMVLAEDVWSRTGMKILPAGTQLTPHILKLVRQFPLDPTLESVQVLK